MQDEFEHKGAFAKGEIHALKIMMMVQLGVAGNVCPNCYSQGMATWLLGYFISSMSDEEAALYLKEMSAEVLKRKRGEAETPPSRPDERPLH